MTAEEIKDFGFKLLGQPIDEHIVVLVQLMIGDGRDHVQLARMYGRSTAVQIAKEIRKEGLA